MKHLKPITQIFALTLICLACSSPKHLKVRYCTIEVKECATNRLDTIKYKVYGGLCIAGSDSALIDKSNRVLRTNVCDYRILTIEK